MDDQIEIKDLDEATPSDSDWLVFQSVDDDTVYKAPKSDLKGDKGDKGDTGSTGAAGAKGDKGDTGDAATLDAGTTSTGSPGTDASVANVGTPNAAIFNFVIPRGETGSKGDKGDTGDQGPAGPAGAGIGIETPTGTIDSSNTSFSVSHAPIFVMIDSRLCISGYGYTYSGGTISVDSGAPPVQSIASFYNL